MRLTGLQVVITCVFLQVPGCFPSCLIVGSVANCAAMNLHSVPDLPPNITHLYLEMNHIAEINSTSLSGLEELQELDLGKQLVPLVIRNNSFIRQGRLRKLVLGFNLGLQLEPLAFTGLSNLRNLHLDFCALREAILEENFLEPLSSLETLNLYGNQIRRLKPARFFTNMTNLKALNLKLNKIDLICESDLAAFQGKHFSYLNLDSAYLRNMSHEGFDWKSCGNPFRGLSIKTLDFSHNGFSVPTLMKFLQAVEGTKISNLKVSEGPVGRGFPFNNLPDPDRNTFKGLKNSSVQTLDLSKSRILALLEGVFSPLKEVAIIDVSHNKVNKIHRNAFAGLQGHLRMLNLSHNLLGEIYSDTFSSLTSLKVLDLSYNHIGALGYGSFRGLPSLRALYLTGNSLRNLGYPAPLPHLQILLLQDNKLTSSSVSSISRFASNAIQLDIQDNRLTNLGDVFTFLNQLRSLKSLYYGGNPIRVCTHLSTEIPAGQWTNFQILDLHSSSLQFIWSQGRCLDLFDHLGHVLGLNLSHNALQTLPRGIFKGLTSVMEMDLSSNAMTYLQPDVLPKSLKVLHLSNNFIASPDPAAFRSLSHLSLEMNRFYCDQNLRSFLTWLTRTNVTFLSPVEELRCEFPSGFYKVPLLEHAGHTVKSVGSVGRVVE